MSSHSSRVRIRPGLFIVILTTIAVLAGCSVSSQPRDTAGLLTPAPTPAEAVEGQAPAAPPDVARGAVIYASKCQPCHGETGQGDGPRAAQVREQGGQVAKLTVPTVLQSALPAAWYGVVSNGRIERLMPGFTQSLTPQDRWDVLSYVWAMGVPSATLQLGRDLYIDQCQACHGPRGKVDGPQTSRTAKVGLSTLAYLAQHSLNDVMDAMAKGDPHRAVTLDDAQRTAVANAVRSFAYDYADTVALRQSALSGDGILRLEATNLTPGGPAVQDLPVDLRVYDSTGEVFSRTARLDARGVVTFSNLPRENSYFYQPDVVYDGAKFFGMPQQFTGTQSLTGTIPVYEVTTDPGVIAISEFHYFVQDVGEGVVSVVEFYIFDNNSDRAFVDRPGPAGQLRSLSVMVPADAQNLRFDGPGLGARFSRDGDTLYDSDAVPPGERATTIAMIYDVPYRGNRHVERPMTYPVKQWDVLLPENEMRVNGLVDRGLQQMQTGSIHLYSPEQAAVPAGSALTFELTGQPRVVAPPGADGRAIGLGLVALAIAAGLAYFLVTRVRRVQGVEDELANDRQALLHQIADLDTQFAGGQIKESTYRTQRDLLKEQLRKIW